jgi:hypothetical protein
VPDASLALQVFLKRLRTVLAEQSRVMVVDRDKNLDAMHRFGLNKKEICKRLAKLGPSNYWKGPEADDDGSDGSVWFFFHDEFGARFYVKLKLYVIEGEDRLTVLSFHD